MKKKHVSLDRKEARNIHQNERHISPTPPHPTTVCVCVYILCDESEINVSWMLIVIDMLNTKQLNTCRQSARRDQKKKDRITVLAV